MEQESLKPCPFCNGNAEFYGNWGCDCCYVRCTECFSCGAKIYCDTDNEAYKSGDSSKEKALAIEAWNRRGEVKINDRS